VLQRGIFGILDFVRRDT